MQLGQLRAGLLSARERQKKSWYAIDLIVDHEAREAAEYGLMEAGALGTETQAGRDETLRVTGYFEELPNRELVRSKLLEALQIYEAPSSSLRQMDLREVPDEDWLAEWKENWRPIVTGRFMIAPPWHNEPRSEERRVGK